MVREAESHRAEDQRRRDQVEAHNAADTAIFQVEKFITDTPNLSADSKSMLEGKIAAVRSAMQGSDSDRTRSVTDELMNAWQQVGAQMHQAAPDQPQAPFSDGNAASDAPPPPPSPGDEDIVEGEYREA